MLTLSQNIAADLIALGDKYRHEAEMRLYALSGSTNYQANPELRSRMQADATLSIMFYAAANAHKVGANG